MSDPGLTVLDGYGALTINDVSMRTPAWLVLDLSPLWGFPDLRRGSTLVPGKAGRQPNPRRVDETTHQLPMQITGAVDHLGAQHSDPIQGLKDNLDYLWENVLDPTIGTTVPAVLELPNGSELTADVQVQITVAELEGAYDKPAVLFLTIPAGRFAETGS